MVFMLFMPLFCPCRTWWCPSRERVDGECECVVLALQLPKDSINSAALLHMGASHVANPGRLARPGAVRTRDRPDRGGSGPPAIPSRLG